MKASDASATDHTQSSNSRRSLPPYPHARALYIFCIRIGTPRNRLLNSCMNVGEKGLMIFVSRETPFDSYWTQLERIARSSSGYRALLPPRPFRAEAHVALITDQTLSTGLCFVSMIYFLFPGAKELTLEEVDDLFLK